MKKSLKYEMRNLKGGPLTSGPPANEPLVYKNLLSGCLFAESRDGSRLTSAQRRDRWLLAQRIEAATDEVELSSEEITLLKELCASEYPTLASGQIIVELEK